MAPLRPYRIDLGLEPPGSRDGYKMVLSEELPRLEKGQRAGPWKESNFTSEQLATMLDAHVDEVGISEWVGLSLHHKLWRTLRTMMGERKLWCVMVRIMEGGGLPWIEV